MRILILEDNESKLQELKDHFSKDKSKFVIDVAKNFYDYIKLLNQEQYDFLILDLVIPRHAHSQDDVGLEEIVEVTRGDYKCKNFRTPGLALTGYDEKAEASFRLLNQHDLAVITYEPGSETWRSALDRKIAGMSTSRRFDFVIFCALEKEANGFAAAGLTLGESEIIAGLHCRSIRLADREGVVVIASRMGLITAAIVSTHAIQSFKPQVVCMSGICGGVPGSAKIYDVIIADPCHQHDVGKWENGKLKPEVYSNSIDHKFSQRIRATVSKDEYRKSITVGITPNRNEYPEGMNEFLPSVRLAPASSGSAVLGDGKVVQDISGQQRKSEIFDMESYAIYEAARLSPIEPLFFSAKSVVDDGSAGKSDAFHLIGCRLSAKVISDLINLAFSN